MNRFFVQEDQIQSGKIQIHSEDALHIHKVLRLSPGDEIEVCDGQGTDHVAQILSVTKQEVLAHMLSSHPSVGEPKVEIVLYQGIPKGQKMDYIIQKAVEIGVHTIVPVITDRTVVKIESEKDAVAKTQRWNRIAYEACKQSGRGRIVRVLSPKDFSEALQEIKDFPLGFMAYEKECKLPISSVLRGERSVGKVAFMVGPEGGFSDAEAECAKALGIKTVSLGSRILRTETAPVYVLSVLIYEFETGEAAG